MHKRIMVSAAWMGALLAVSTFSGMAQLAAPMSLTVSNDGRKTVQWPLVPGLDTLQFRVGQRLETLTPVSPLTITKTPSGYVYSTSNQLSSQFYSLRLGQMSEDAVATANLLNRIAYGPTPDELERLALVGPNAYITEQLAPETIPSSIDSYVSVTTNGVPMPPPTWTSITVTGNVQNAQNPLYIYFREIPGQVSVDSVEFYYRYTLTAITNTAGVLTTNVYTNMTTNLVVNGGFDQPLGAEWAFDGTSHDTSFRDTANAAAGVASLRLVATAPGTGNGNSIRQTLAAPPVTLRGTNGSGQIWTNTVSQLRGVMSFAYLPTANSHYLTVRISGDGTVGSGNDAPDAPEWIYATATGTATTTPTLYLYLNGAGETWIDDLKLVAGSVPEAGPNLIASGNFEAPLGSPWTATADFDTSYVDNTVSHSGGGSLRLIAEAAGAGANDSLFITNLAVANAQTYTVSYWYRPGPATRGRQLTVRLSGSGVNSVPDTLPSGIKRRLDREDFSVSLDDLRAWFCNNTVASPRQLLEVLTQFFENHFVTQHSKTSDYFDRYYDGLQNQVATDLEYREVSRWRAALSNPNCTFYDLLKVHVESPAQIIYLDTVGSTANGNNVANENYARELFELFAMGVDNGYDQQDIVAMSRAWSGWTIDIVDRSQVDNPFAVRSREYGRYPGVGFNAVSNIIGVWTFVFNNAAHGTNRAPILSVWDTNASPTNPRPLAGEAGKKKYPARFGSPWVGTSYQLVIPPGRTAPDTAILDGYDVIRHLSTNLFTAEFLSVKLCRLFIHDDFVHGVYDYTDPNRSREAELIRQCILAWDTPGTGTVGGRGNIRRVISTILASDLFREHAATLQKVKTPLEFVASAVRALRSVNPDGSATATTDGTSFISPLSRMGVMSLFNRAEPDGYPEYAAAWISAGTLAERVRFIQSLLTAANATPARPGDAGNNFANPVALLKKKLPSSAWNTDAAVVDYFLGVIYPGEGRANLDQYRAAAISFLNTADNGTTASAFNGLGNTSTTYDTRVRGMVAYLMTLQRFHEQ